MTDADALTIGWTQAQAATRRIAYRRLLGFNLIVQTAVGLIAVVVPVWLAHKADLPGPPSPGWVQLWGVMLLIMAILYLPGCIEPVHAASKRFPPGRNVWATLRKNTCLSKKCSDDSITHTTSKTFARKG